MLVIDYGRFLPQEPVSSPSDLLLDGPKVFNRTKLRQRIRERRTSAATWRKELHLAVASGSGGEEREHATLAWRPVKAGAGFVKAAASLPRAGRLRVEEAPPGGEPGQVVVPPPEEKGWRRGGLCP